MLLHRGFARAPPDALREHPGELVRSVVIRNAGIQIIGLADVELTCGILQAVHVEHYKWLQR
jgi:hypothetical protein